MPWKHRRDFTIEEAVEDFLYPTRLQDVIGSPKKIDHYYFWKTVTALPGTTGRLSMAHALNRRLGDNWTYTRIAREVGVSVGRAREVCLHAGRILRNPSRRSRYER